MSRTQFRVLVGLGSVFGLVGLVQAAELRIGNLVRPDPFNAGDVFWFDIFVEDAMGESAEAAQVTLSVIGPGALAFDAAASEAVSGEPHYWVFGNSVGAAALDLGSDVYQFGDGPNDPPSAALADGDMLARFAFVWDGVEADYVVTVDTSPLQTFLLEDFVTVEPTWVQNPVTIHVPEPHASVLLVTAGLVLGHRRSRGNSR